MELSIVILNYRTKGLLKQCLRGIADSQLAMEHEVIVVDNNSNDGSVEMVAEFFPWAKRLPLKTNGGFAVGNNAGIAAATGEYIMVINPDVAVFRGAVDTLLAYMKQHPTVGIAVPKLINPDGTVQMSAMRFPNFSVPIWRRTPLGKLPIPQKILRRYHMAEWDHKDNRQIGWALGACMLIRRTALNQVGTFDERFFLYLEDVDLCRRMWAKQWEVHYVAQAEMVHFHQRLSATAAVLTSMFSYAARIHIASWIAYFKKYSGQPAPPAELCL
jgi:GT2 family glycosyltransferase